MKSVIWNVKGPKVGKSESPEARVVRVLSAAFLKDVSLSVQKIVGQGPTFD